MLVEQIKLLTHAMPQMLQVQERGFLPPIVN